MRMKKRKVKISKASSEKISALVRRENFSYFVVQA